MPRGPRLRVLFDGACGLCSRTVRFLYRFEDRARFIFTPFQSEAGQLIAKRIGIDAADPASFAVLDETGHAYFKSEGAFFALGHCRQPWRFVAGVCRLLPRALCKGVYDFVARRRISLFGTADICDLPPPLLRERMVLDASDKG